MKNSNYPHLATEDGGATIDFLTEGVAVELSFEAGKLHVRATMSHGEEASSWNEREVAWELPERPAMLTLEDDDDQRRVSLDDFLRDIIDDDDDAVAAVKALAPGESVELGGGAVPRLRVTRDR